MASVLLLVGKVPAIAVPPWPWRFPFVLEALYLRFDLFTVGYLEQVQLVSSEFVARQRIRPMMQDGPAASFGRGLDQVNFFAVPRRDAPGDKVLRVRGPFDSRVSVALLAVLGQLLFLAVVG